MTTRASMKQTEKNGFMKIADSLDKCKVWAILSREALKRAWSKEDAVWDKIACGKSKQTK